MRYPWRLGTGTGTGTWGLGLGGPSLSGKFIFFLSFGLLGWRVFLVRLGLVLFGGSMIMALLCLGLEFFVSLGTGSAS